MTHPRETIMQRIVAVLETTGESVRRNTISANDAELPIISLLEGDEATDEEDPINRPVNAPRRVTMTPAIIVVTGRNLGSPPIDVGPSMNAIYAAVLQAMLNDAELAALSLDGRGVRFLGMETDLALGRMLLGQMSIKFSITYALKPSDL